MKKKYFLIFNLFVFSFCASALADIDYERQIHRIYLKHYKDPVSHIDWSDKIRLLPQNYKLKFRDNLWDLSKSFFKNSLYWSKLWVANPKVENPHRIYRGDFIKFDPKTLAGVNTSKYSVDLQAQFPGLVIPEDKWSKGALAPDEIPSSLPELKLFYSAGGIDIRQLRNIDFDKQMIVPFFLVDSPLTSSGEVVRKDGYGKFINLSGEQLIVRMNDDVSIGDIYTVFTNRGGIGFVGLGETEIMVQGTIRISSYLQGTDALYIATVLESMQKISPGASLSRGEPMMYNFSQKGELGSTGGRIIGNPHKSQKLLNLGSIVYLDKGNDDVQPGEVFYILAKLQKGNLKRPYNYQALIGKLAVIHTTHHKATGIIIESRDYIRVGDIFTGNLETVENLFESTVHEAVEDQAPVGYEFAHDFEENPEVEDDFIPDDLEGYEEIPYDEDMGFFDQDNSPQESEKIQVDEELEIEFDAADDLTQDPSNLKVDQTSQPKAASEAFPSDESQEANVVPLLEEPGAASEVPPLGTSQEVN